MTKKKKKLQVSLTLDSRVVGVVVAWMCRQWLEGVKWVRAFDYISHVIVRYKLFPLFFHPIISRLGFTWKTCHRILKVMMDSFFKCSLCIKQILPTNSDTTTITRQGNTWKNTLPLTWLHYSHKEIEKVANKSEKSLRTSLFDSFFLITIVLHAWIYHSIIELLVLYSIKRPRDSA